MLLLVLGLTGCQTALPSTQEEIVLSMNDAKQIALSHGFIKDKESEFLVEELVDSDPSYYLLVIHENEDNYMYKIDAQSGKILVSSNQETEKSIANEIEVVKKAQDDVVAVEKDDNQPTQTETPKKQDTQTLKNISKEQALEIALRDAGLNKSEVTSIDIEDKVKEGVKAIEVEFYKGDYEYEYLIIVSNGNIMKNEIEYKGALNNSNPISMAQAKQMALKRVSGANDNHIKIKEDTDDGRIVYEGKIIYNGFEYEFDIDAKSGIFLEWEKEALYQ